MPSIIAHRGASAEAPENTISSIQRAIDIGVDFIEIDVHLSLDSIPVVIHDPTPRRITGGKIKKKIERMNLEDIRNLDAGSWFQAQFSKEKIPALKEVLALDRKSAGLMIEIKKGGVKPEAMADALIKVIGNPKGQNLLLGSFAPEILRAISDQNPYISTMGILEKKSMIPIFRGMKLPRLAIWYKILDDNLIKSLQDEGIEVWTFTVDKPEIADHLISLNVNGIITNDPRLLKSYLSN